MEVVSLTHRWSSLDPQVVIPKPAGGRPGLEGRLLQATPSPAACARSSLRGCRSASNISLPMNAPQAKQPVLQQCCSPSHPWLQGGQPHAQLPQEGRIVHPHGPHCAGDDARLVHLQGRGTHFQLWATSRAEAHGRELHQQLCTCKATLLTSDLFRHTDCSCACQFGAQLPSGRQCTQQQQAVRTPVRSCGSKVGTQLLRKTGNCSGHMPVC